MTRGERGERWKKVLESATRGEKIAEAERLKAERLKAERLEAERLEAERKRQRVERQAEAKRKAEWEQEEKVEAEWRTRREKAYPGWGEKSDREKHEDWLKAVDWAARKDNWDKMGYGKQMKQNDGEK